jgi:hypothetical protein
MWYVQYASAELVELVSGKPRICETLVWDYGMIPLRPMGCSVLLDNGIGCS